MADTNLILKNTGETGIIWGGISIDASSQCTLQDADLPILMNNDPFIAALYTGMAVINNGLSDLPYGMALRAVKKEPLLIGDDAFIEDAYESNTTMSEYQTKLTISMTASLVGYYAIMGNASISSSHEGIKMYNRIFIDDSITRKEQICEMSYLKYSDGAFIEYATIAIISFTAGAHTVKLQYHSDSKKTMYIKEASIIVRRLV